MENPGHCRAFVGSHPAPISSGCPASLERLMVLLALVASSCAASEAVKPGTASTGGAATGGSVATGTGGRAAVGSGGSASPSGGGGAGAGARGAVTSSGGGVVATSATGGAGGSSSSSSSDGGVGRVDLTGKRVLLVVDDPASLTDGEMMLLELMTIGRDMIVTTADTVTANPGVAGMSLIVASSGAGASELATLYKDAAVPMLVFGNSAYQALGFIAASAGKGTTSTPVMLTVLDAATSLASGLPVGTNFSAIGTSRSTSIYWGSPAGAPIKVAGVVGSPTQLVSFAYDKGAAMAAGTAPARRVGLGFKTDVLGDLSVESFKLLNAALEWLAVPSSK